MEHTSPVAAHLRAVYEHHLPNRSGVVADYIPELAKVEPDLFGIAIALVDGHVYEVGDSRHEFTIQSVSKAFTFGLALEDHGRSELLRRVGVEPTGDPFNSIVLDEDGNRPPNPMVNAGAIAVTGLVMGANATDRWARILGNLSAFAGRPLSVDDAVARSEELTGHRNRAIAHLMRGFDMIRPEVDEVLDLYFRQCAVNVNAVDLALMGATLAAGGRQPRTGAEVIGSEETASVLSVMSSCGMYDWSGEWIYRVGLPAKSGVGGGIVAVLPGHAAIGVFSPRLDAKGNSVRGLLACEQLSRELGMHLFVGNRTSATALRSAYGRDAVSSSYHRLADEEQALRVHGSEIHIVELQGALAFGSIELLSRLVVSLLSDTNELLLDFGRVPEIEAEAEALLLELIDECVSAGVAVGLVAVPASALFELRAFSRAKHDGTVRFHDDLDAALEPAEDRLLRRHGLDGEVDGVDLAAASVCVSLDADDLDVLRAVTRERSFGRGETLARPGDPTTSAWIVLGGIITIAAPDGPANGPGRRLRSVGPGSIVGEMALISGAPRSAWITAETPVRVRELDPQGLDEFTTLRPAGAAMLYRNLCGVVGGWLRDSSPIPSRRSRPNG